MDFDDYQIALLFSVLVLVPLASWKITGMVKKLQKMSYRGKEEKEGLTLKQKEFVKFLEKASNQKKRKTMADVKLNSGSDDVGMKFKIIGISVAIGLNAIVFILMVNMTI